MPPRLKKRNVTRRQGIAAGNPIPIPITGVLVPDGDIGPSPLQRRRRARVGGGMVEGVILVISIGEISMRMMGDAGDSGGFVSGGGGGASEAGSVVIVVVAAGVGGGRAARLGEGHGLGPI